MPSGNWAASRWPIARYSERHPRQRCGARPKTPGRKKFSIHPGGFLNLHSQHRFPATSPGSAAFRQLTREKECQGAAQTFIDPDLILAKQMADWRARKDAEMTCCDRLAAECPSTRGNCRTPIRLLRHAIITDRQPGFAAVRIAERDPSEARICRRAVHRTSS